MKGRRNRTKQQLSLEQRLFAFSEQCRQQAKQTTDETLRNNLEQRVRSTEAALGLIAWLGSRDGRR